MIRIITFFVHKGKMQKVLDLLFFYCKYENKYIKISAYLLYFWFELEPMA